MESAKPPCARHADYAASNSGVMCVSLSGVISGKTVHQGSPYAYSPQCSFGLKYRTHKREEEFTMLRLRTFELASYRQHGESDPEVPC